MSNVVHMHACRCGKPGQTRTLANDTRSVTFIACSECMERSTNFLARMRPVFEAMIACGVPRDLANDTMTFMLDRMPDDEQRAAQ